MKEKLTLVISESQLRPGLLVEVRKCFVCGRDHRELLVRAETLPCNLRGRDHCPAWHEASVTHNDYRPCCFARAIRERRLFIVESGLDVGADAIEGHRLYNSPRAKEWAR